MAISKDEALVQVKELAQEAKAVRQKMLDLFAFIVQSIVLSGHPALLFSEELYTDDPAFKNSPRPWHFFSGESTVRVRSQFSEHDDTAIGIGADGLVYVLHYMDDSNAVQPVDSIPTDQLSDLIETALNYLENLDVACATKD